MMKNIKKLTFVFGFLLLVLYSHTNAESIPIENVFSDI
jgi:hypothetical protein